MFWPECVECDRFIKEPFYLICAAECLADGSFRLFAGESDISFYICTPCVIQTGVSRPPPANKESLVGAWYGLVPTFARDPVNYTRGFDDLPTDFHVMEAWVRYVPRAHVEAVLIRSLEAEREEVGRMIAQWQWRERLRERRERKPRR